MSVDLKRELSSFAARKGRFDVIEVPALRYLMIDGVGDPNTSSAYADALATLYPASYVLKFAAKAAGSDYVVPPLEALWWADDMDTFTSARDKSQWHWTAMIMTPSWITAADVDTARAAAAAKGAPSIDLLRWEELDEGLCMQTLHVGSYDDEAPMLAHMHDVVIPGEGLVTTGRHHEIYLSDPRRTAPEKLRTILRQPVARA